MEFKKNRQSVILESHSALKSPDFISAPAFLSEAKATKALQNNIKGATKRVEEMKTRIRRLLVKPAVHDPVYKIIQRVFIDQTPFNLTRENKVRFVVRRLAFKRFILGYPPRKRADTSIGDAINWEWIIRCAQQGNFNVIVVSRDSDYGVTFAKAAYINDWLLREFRDRVSKKRQITLIPRLSEAFEMLKVPISAEEEKVEEELVEASEENRIASTAPSTISEKYFDEWLKTMQQKFDDRQINRR